MRRNFYQERANHVSAAAAVRVQSRAEKLLTSSERQQKIKLEAGYSNIPNSYFDDLPRKIPLGVEYALIGLILRRTYGGKERLQWTVLTAHEAASALIVSLEAAEQGLRAAELHGFVEARFFGRQKYYAARPDKFAAAPDKEQREIDRKPPASETELRSAQATLDVAAGGRAQLPGSPHWCSNKFPVPIRASISEREDGTLEFEAAPAGEYKANDTRTPVRLSGGGGVENNGSSNVANGHAPEDIGMMRDFLNRWCRERLGPVDDDIVRKCLKARGAATMQDCAGRLRARLPRVAHATWKLVVLIIGDAGKAAGKAQLTPGLTERELAELDEWTERQRKGNP